MDDGRGPCPAAGRQFESPLPTLTAAFFWTRRAPTRLWPTSCTRSEQLSSIEPALLRPPMVQVQYGSFTFNGVIEVLSVKYSRFGPTARRPRHGEDRDPRRFGHIGDAAVAKPNRPRGRAVAQGREMEVVDGARARQGA